MRVENWKQNNETPIKVFKINPLKVLPFKYRLVPSKEGIWAINNSYHDDKQEYDAQRDAFLESLSLTEIHVTAKDVLQYMGGFHHHVFTTSP